MKAPHFLTWAFAMFACWLPAQSSQNIAERLGYAPDAKLLIIHADDIGVAHAVNRATISAFEKGIVNSGSIMVPCPWFPEIADYARKTPSADLGLHLTLTAEWKNFKWKPVTSISEVPGLVNEQNFLYDNCGDVVLNASVEEVEKEIRAQIERAIAFGIEPTHLDSHMGCLFNPKFFPTYMKVGREYGLPVLLTIQGLQQFPGIAAQMKKYDVAIEQVLMIYPQQAAEGMSDYYAQALRNLQPGLTEIIIHAGYDDAELRAVTIDHPDYGAAWRQQDYDFFTSETCRKILEEENIQLVTWRQIKALIPKEKE